MKHKIEFVNRSYGWWSVTLDKKYIIDIDSPIERLFGQKIEVSKNDVDDFSKWVCMSNKKIINKYSLNEYEVRNTITKSLIDFLSRWQRK